MFHLHHVVIKNSHKTKRQQNSQEINKNYFNQTEGVKFDPRYKYFNHIKEFCFVLLIFLHLNLQSC